MICDFVLFTKSSLLFSGWVSFLNNFYNKGFDYFVSDALVVFDSVSQILWNVFVLTEGLSYTFVI